MKMDKQLFADLKEALGEAIEHAEGKRELRTTTLPRPPQKLTSAEIAALRGNMNVSQAVFAHYLNVSVKTVQSWEQGKTPGGAALKLLSIVKNNPKILLEA
jgi:putative transcriptional regulator